MRNTHTPATMRKVGITALINYSIGAIIVFIYGLLVSRNLWNELPNWNINIFHVPLQTSIDTLKANNLEFTRLFLTLGIVLAITLKWLFDSSIAIKRIRYFRNMDGWVAGLCLIYLIIFYNLEYDNCPELTKDILLGALYLNIPLVILLGHFEKKPKIFDKLVVFTGAYWAFGFLALQIFSPQPFFWELILIF